MLKYILLILVSSVCHAEMNALLIRSRDVKGATLYCTHSPCWDCARDMLEAGIAQVVYGKVYEQAVVDHLTDVMKQR